MQPFVNIGRLHNISSKRLFKNFLLSGMRKGEVWLFVRGRGWAKALQNMQNY
jgi:hypothetical protein